ncbi:MAG: hypothetical protein J0I13_05425, partial [Rhizobiales bacterium]|nr:hypothetical protein [Hyphomicrobiales bacterium]
MDARTTAGDIDAKITDAERQVADLERQAQELALPAVSGDQAAAESLARIKVSITQIRADIDVLRNARVTVVAQHDAEVVEAAAAYRSRYLNIARGHAAELLELAR